MGNVKTTRILPNLQNLNFYLTNYEISHSFNQLIGRPLHYYIPDPTPYHYTIWKDLWNPHIFDITEYWVILIPISINRGMYSSLFQSFYFGIVNDFSAFSDEFMPSGSHTVKVETKFDHYLLCLFNLLGKVNKIFVSKMFHMKKLKGKFVLIAIYKFALFKLILTE
jgi:hypothetical protein